MIMDCLSAGGLFTGVQALDFRDPVVEMGHDRPRRARISDSCPMLGGLGVFHGKRGSGVSVECDVRRHGPVTVLGIAGRRDGSVGLVVPEGEVMDGPVLRIANTTSRVVLATPQEPAHLALEGSPVELSGRSTSWNLGEWRDAWVATGVGHHWALVAECQAGPLGALGELFGMEVVRI
jgi:L-arabinose isomerase